MPRFLSVIFILYTKDLKSYTRNADIIVAATGKPGVIKGNIIEEGTMLIDVGISKVGNTVKGDIDFESVKDKASIITPVPGGVGPVTIACSFKNTLRLFKKSLNF